MQIQRYIDNRKINRKIDRKIDKLQIDRKSLISKTNKFWDQIFSNTIKIFSFLDPHPEQFKQLKVIDLVDFMKCCSITSFINICWCEMKMKSEFATRSYRKIIEKSPI